MLRFLIVLFLIMAICIVPPAFCASQNDGLNNESKESVFDFRLVGTVIYKEAIACFEEFKSKRITICRIGDRIGQVYKVVGIKRGEVILEKDSNRIALGLWTGPVMSIVRPSTYEMSQLSSLVEIRPEVDMETGEFLGLRLGKIKSDNIIKMAGIKEGDLINNINGQRLSNLQKTIQVIKKAKKLSDLEIGLLRKNKPIRLKYKFHR